MQTHWLINREVEHNRMVYQHQKYGALPIANSEIIYLPQLTVEEIEREKG